MAMIQQASEMKVIRRKLHIIFYERETNSHGYVLKNPQM